MNDHKRVLSALMLSLALLPFLVSSPPPAEAQAGKKHLTYEQAFPAPARPGQEPASGVIEGELPTITGWLDDERYLESRIDPADKQRKLYAVSAIDGGARVHIDYAEIQKNLPQGFDARAAAASNTALTSFVFNRDSDLYHYDATSKRFRRLTSNGGAEKNPRFSPNGKWIAYTRDNNLYAYDLDSSIEHQYTTDGSDTIYNGWSSWVYMEEILGRASNYAAFWWSPDSTRLAFMRFDDSPVPIFPIYHADGQHGELERQRYPKAGDPNPYVAMGVVPVSGGKITWMDFEAKADHYIAWPFWTPDSKVLTVQWMNRAQDTIRFFNCDPATGKRTQIFQEKQPSWVEFFEDLYYFHDGSGFLLRSSVDGWEHLYYYSNNGTLKKRLTSGNWRVNSISRVDEKGGYIYFTGRPAKTWDAHLMRVKLDGSGLEQLTKDEGIHRSQVSPGGKYFVDSVSTITSPGSTSLRRGDGTLVRKLGERKAPSDYAWGKAELFTIPSEDGQFNLPAYWILPPDFDPAKQYPVVFSIYGGPDAGTVHNTWPSLQAHYFAQRGVITVSVDHRASGHFGKKGVSLMHRSLGKWEMVDLITAAKWLRGKPFVAKDKIGIFGGSYGGYVTMLALTYGAGHFNYGQAAASVTDWQLYDTVYTERLMDTPKENPEGYKNGSVMTWIDRYKGGLRITHGTIDDNVHMQNSMQVIDWLTSNNKPFELMMYPDSRHGLQMSQRAHMSREAHDFWMRTLLQGRSGETA
ncbi:MAG TPA: S9 family peptidase, partial [Blastocatellia bacterium]|nr:S9 family peptidase [Blastocatellia bacterium]